MGFIYREGALEGKGPGRGHWKSLASIWSGGRSVKREGTAGRAESSGSGRNGSWRSRSAALPGVGTGECPG